MLPDNHFYSTLLGYISLAACVAISLPQAFLHWRQKSAKGISLTMLWLWLIGDFASLAGAVVQGLLHTLIILGAINGLIDILIIWQCYHYAKWQQFARIFQFLRIRNPSPDASVSAVQHQFITPSLTPTAPASPGPKKSRKLAFHHTLYVILVVGIAVMVWGIVVARVRNTANLHPGEDGTDPEFSTVGAVFGWLSMAIFTTSRYPQIYKNWKLKSCQNLSIWFFILLIIYSVTNLGSMLVKSHTRAYIIVNLPWIANSSFSIVLDLIIMSQFAWYRKVKGSTEEPIAPIPRPECVQATEEPKDMV